MIGAEVSFDVGAVGESVMVTMSKASRSSQVI